MKKLKKKLKKAFSIPGEELPGSLTADVLYIAIDLVNLSIPGSAFQLSLNSHSKRLERQLSKSYIMAGARRTEFLKRERIPRKRQEFLDSYKKLAILINGIISPDISSLEK